MISRRKKKRKRHWTTKNTHIQKKKKKTDKIKEEVDVKYRIVAIIFLAGAILIILLIALNNHIIGYDYFPQMPHEWVRSLFDR